MQVSDLTSIFIGDRVSYVCFCFVNVISAIMLKLSKILCASAKICWGSFSPDQASAQYAMDRSQCFEWHSRFLKGRTAVEVDEKSGRPTCDLCEWCKCGKNSCICQRRFSHHHCRNFRRLNVSARSVHQKRRVTTSLCGSNTLLHCTKTNRYFSKN